MVINLKIITRSERTGGEIYCATLSANINNTNLTICFMMVWIYSHLPFVKQGYDLRNALFSKLDLV